MVTLLTQIAGQTANRPVIGKRAMVENNRTDCLTGWRTLVQAQPGTCTIVRKVPVQ